MFYLIETGAHRVDEISSYEIKPATIQLTLLGVPSENNYGILMRFR